MAGVYVDVDVETAMRKKTHWSFLRYSNPIRWKHVNNIAFCGLKISGAWLTGTKAVITCYRCLTAMRPHGHLEVEP